MAWYVWLLAACGFGVGEVMSAGSFYLAPFAIGALLAAGVGAAGSELAAWLVFLAVSMLTLVTIRPLLTAKLHQTPALRTGAAAMIGHRVRVLETIDNHAGTGQVKLDGETWTARAYDDDSVIAAGTDVEVVTIRGATAIVLP